MTIDEELGSYFQEYRDIDYDFSMMEGDTLKYTYGTTPFDTFSQIVNGMRRPKRLVVLGSSIGWQCFYWNRMFPDIPAIGYEIHDVRYDFSNYLLEKYRLDNITFFNESLVFADVQDGDLIWQNNACIDSELCDEVSWRALTRKKEIGIVSYRSILFDRQLDGGILLVDEAGGFSMVRQRTINLPTSWSEEQPFHILEQ